MTVSMPRPFTASRRDSKGITLAAGVLLVFLASLLRLDGFEETFLAWDQSYLISNAIETARLHPPLAGIKSSVGVYQTAVVSYLAAIPWLLVPASSPSNGFSRYWMGSLLRSCIGQ